MPEIFADQHAHPAKTRIKSVDAVAFGKETSLIEHPVSGQVNLVVHMQYFSIRKVRAGDRQWHESWRVVRYYIRFTTLFFR